MTRDGEGGFSSCAERNIVIRCGVSANVTRAYAHVISPYYDCRGFNGPAARRGGGRGAR